MKEQAVSGHGDEAGQGVDRAEWLTRGSDEGEWMRDKGYSWLDQQHSTARQDTTR